MNVTNKLVIIVSCIAVIVITVLLLHTPPPPAAVVPAPLDHQPTAARTASILSEKVQNTGRVLTLTGSAVSEPTPPMQSDLPPQWADWVEADSSIPTEAELNALLQEDRSRLPEPHELDYLSDTTRGSSFARRPLVWRAAPGPGVCLSPGPVRSGSAVPETANGLLRATR